jgi:hypothetical protein
MTTSSQRPPGVAYHLSSHGSRPARFSLSAMRSTTGRSYSSYDRRTSKVGRWTNARGAGVWAPRSFELKPSLGREPQGSNQTLQRISVGLAEAAFEVLDRSRAEAGSLRQPCLRKAGFKAVLP